MSNKTGWLIEHLDLTFGTHRWLRIAQVPGCPNRTGIPEVELMWTDTAEVALRFARYDDARNFALLHRDYCTLCKITEHQFGLGDGE